MLAKAGSAAEVTAKIEAIERTATLPDQWQAQVLARVLEHNQVILVSDMCDHQLIKNMQMTAAGSLSEALTLAREKLGAAAEIVLIPDGVAVIVNK